MQFLKNPSHFKPQQKPNIETNEPENPTKTKTKTNKSGTQSLKTNKLDSDTMLEHPTQKFQLPGREAQLAHKPISNSKSS
jgi:hypothetical protein